jgi:hypothetical protein
MNARWGLVRRWREGKGRGGAARGSARRTHAHPAEGEEARGGEGVPGSAAGTTMAREAAGGRWMTRPTGGPRLSVREGEGEVE